MTTKYQVYTSGNWEIEFETNERGSADAWLTHMPSDACASLACASGEGYVQGLTNVITVPAHVLKWAEKLADNHPDY